ncbi:MAG: hypothetical protein A3G93_01125 [Nitrospinae bacterium RIFCSPLOWO2_12_FULL_45_22]|nr:MAG: hypothetical protein A3G93_01125 [Nitrospinae bacterium RIFCSPLOWO2_12_FULL_45_22]
MDFLGRSKWETLEEKIVDIVDGKRRVLVIAEMPGVSEEEINIDIAGDVLLLLASHKDKKYSNEIFLPARVKRETMKYIYKNGLLEITIDKELARKPGQLNYI